MGDGGGGGDCRHSGLDHSGRLPNYWHRIYSVDVDGDDAAADVVVVAVAAAVVEMLEEKLASCWDSASAGEVVVDRQYSKRKHRRDCHRLPSCYFLRRIENTRSRGDY